MKQSVLSWKGRLQVVVWAGSLLLGITSIARAHSDPWGDIHPHVSVLDGKFSIVFNTKVPDQNDDYSDAQPVNRMIFNQEGTLFSPRHPLDKKRAWDAHGSVDLSGREISLGNDTLIFRGGDGQPGYFLRAFDGRTAEVRMPWPKDVSLVLFEDVMVTPAGIAITGKHADSSVEGTSLYLYWFAHEETTTGTVVRIGPTACIYDFPVASNIAFAGGRFWIAYMGEEKDLKLMLWSWKPGEKEGRVEALDLPADWNSHLSMAAIGNRLCLAYHCVVNEKAEMRNHASIITVFRNAE